MMLGNTGGGGSVLTMLRLLRLLRVLKLVKSLPQLQVGPRRDMFLFPMLLRARNSCLVLLSMPGHRHGLDHGAELDQLHRFDPFHVLLHVWHRRNDFVPGIRPVAFRDFAHDHHHAIPVFHAGRLDRCHVCEHVWLQVLRI